MCLNFGYCGLKEFNVLNYLLKLQIKQHAGQNFPTMKTWSKLCLCLVILTPKQIQYGGFIRASVKKIGDMIRDRV